MPNPTSTSPRWIMATLTMALMLWAITGCYTTRAISTPHAPMPEASDRVHAFYYPWYANPTTDGHWSHWNHPVLARGWHQEKRYTPPDDIGANFYPQLGCYSTQDPATLATHMRQLRESGVGVISLSWWGPESSEERAVGRILDVAEDHGIKVNFHIEPYANRSAASVRENIRYLIDRHGSRPAFYRDLNRGHRPMFYIYDSYLVDAAEWATILAPKGEQTIRGTDLDAIVIGLWVKAEDGDFMIRGHFDGFYTYFAVDGFTFGSSPRNWPELATWAREHGKLFIPSVGPGYDDTRIRPWNERNRRRRQVGTYYDATFGAALSVEPEIVSITSFNEWHEGTQIEPAVPKTIPGYTYLDYRPHESDYYLHRTRHWVDRFLGRRSG